MYVSGTRARGCVFVLNGTCGDCTINITRESELVTNRYQCQGGLEDITYSFYDWEEDGSRGTLAIPPQLVNTGNYFIIQYVCSERRFWMTSILVPSAKLCCTSVITHNDLLL